MSFYLDENRDEPRIGRIFISIVIFVLILAAALMYVMPIYGVWEKELSGKAQLKEAEWNRKIVIEEANAKKESAKSLAEAEIIRAKGIAKANNIISGSITDEYLRYKFIEGLEDNNNKVIYVPTEANLPILEATRK